MGKLKKYTMKNTQKPLIKVVMPDEFLGKVHHLCTVISQVEWSGILLYDVEGNITDPKNMVIHLKDIILMDKGSTAFTSYNFTEKKRDQSGFVDRHIDYCEEKEEALGWRIGLVHSHNNMNVFFSGTDMDELKENAPSHNFYLSLIVNNALDLQAKIAYMGNINIEVDAVYKGLDVNGEEYDIESTKLVVTKSKYYEYDCDIIVDKTSVVEDSFFLRNIKDVLAEADKPKTVSYGYNRVGYKPTTQTSYSNRNNHSATNSKIAKQTSFEDNRNWWAAPGEDDFFDEMVDNAVDDMSILEDFVIKLFDFEDVATPTDGLEDILLDVLSSSLSSEEITQGVLNRFTISYEDAYQTPLTTAEEYGEAARKAISLIEIWENNFIFISPVIESLEKLIALVEE